MPSSRADEDSFTRRFFKNDLTQSSSKTGPRDNSSNRRRHPRFTIDNYRITCYKGSILHKLGLKKNIAHSVMDVSAIGMRIRTLAEVSMHSTVLIELSLHQFSDTLIAQGKVMWVRPLMAANGRKYFDVGIEFTGQDETQFKKIKAMESWFNSPQRSVKGKP